MTVLGVGLMSSRDYQNFIQRSQRLAVPYKREGRLHFVVNNDNFRPHATILFVNTNREDEFKSRAAEIADATDPIKVPTTKHVLGDDGMREEQNEKTEPLIRLQDRAIRYLVPLAANRGQLLDRTPIIWPEENPTGERLDEVIPQLDKQDPKRQQYETIGYDEASGDRRTLQRILDGKERRDSQMIMALQPESQNPFSRFRPHETEMRIDPESISREDRQALNAPADGRMIEYDLLVVSRRGPHGTFSRPIAAFDLTKPQGQKMIDLNSTHPPLPEPVRFAGSQRKNPFTLMASTQDTGHQAIA